ncbi:cupin domain-containing protein [Aquisphaera insulae]|uniref:cupin domain-containing protein n=1 Tax=Aquisphaera insulae TaxID=2712864 RepID=UPI0013ECFFCC|nr:cupin domain-containing protein [Aquisphaera insulae]
MPSRSESAVAELPVYSVVGDRYTYLLTGDQTGGACFQFEAWVPPGSGPPPHVHSREDEGFYVIEGEFEFVVAGTPVRLTAGGFLLGKRGIPHNFRNVGEHPGRLIITATPAGLEHFFAEIGDRLPGRDADPIPMSPDAVRRLIEAAPRYGLELLPPGEAHA